MNYNIDYLFFTTAVALLIFAFLVLISMIHFTNDKHLKNAWFCFIVFCFIQVLIRGLKIMLLGTNAIWFFTPLISLLNISSSISVFEFSVRAAHKKKHTFSFSMIFAFVCLFVIINLNIFHTKNAFLLGQLFFTSLGIMFLPCSLSPKKSVIKKPVSINKRICLGLFFTTLFLVPGIEMLVEYQKYPLHFLVILEIINLTTIIGLSFFVIIFIHEFYNENFRHYFMSFKKYKKLILFNFVQIVLILSIGFWVIDIITSNGKDKLVKAKMLESKLIVHTVDKKILLKTTTRNYFNKTKQDILKNLYVLSEIDHNIMSFFVWDKKCDKKINLVFQKASTKDTLLPYEYKNRLKQQEISAKIMEQKNILRIYIPLFQDTPDKYLITIDFNTYNYFKEIQNQRNVLILVLLTFIMLTGFILFSSLNKLQKVAFDKINIFLLKHINKLLLVIDNNGKILIANRIAEKFFSHKLSFMIGKDIESIAPQTLADDLSFLYSNCKKRGFSEANLSLPDKYGKKLTFFFKFKSLQLDFLEKKQVVLVTGLDITEQKQVENKFFEINSFFNSLGSSSVENIYEITQAAGLILAGNASIFLEINKGKLHDIAHWNINKKTKISAKFKSEMLRRISDYEPGKSFLFGNTDEVHVSYNLYESSKINFFGMIVSSDNQPKAILGVLFEEDKQFAPLELNLLKTLGHIAIAELERKKNISQLALRDKYMAQLALISLDVISTKTLKKCLPVVIEQLGICSDTSRVSIFEHHVDDKEEPLISQRYEWTNENIKQTIDDPLFKNLPYKRINSTLFDKLHAGECLFISKKEFKDKELGAFQKRDFISALLVPIYTNNNFWGFIAFDECAKVRVWESVEIAMLSVASSLIGSAIERWENEELLELKNVDLELARQTAEEANRLKSEFLANTSHELRTPLNSIQGFLDFIRSGRCKNQQEIDECITASYESAVHLTKIINDVLDIAKIEAGKLDISFEEIDLKRFFDELRQMTHVQAKQKNVELIFPNLKQEEIVIETDGQRLRQVLLNLISNSLKFTEQGHIKISVNPIPDIGYVLFEIEDTGIGIETDKQDILLNSFVQADSSVSRKYGGTGLGLSICKSLIEKMGGNILLFSEGLNQGTFIVFTLPINGTEDLSTEKQDAMTIGNPDDPLIMLLDKDEEFLKSLSGILVENSYSVLCTTQIDEACKKACVNKPDLFVIRQDSGIDTAKLWHDLIEFYDNKYLFSIPLLILTGEETVKEHDLSIISNPPNEKNLMDIVSDLQILKKKTLIEGLVMSEDTELIKYFKEIDSLSLKNVSGFDAILDELSENPQQIDILFLDIAKCERDTFREIQFILDALKSSKIKIVLLTVNNDVKNIIDYRNGKNPVFIVSDPSDNVIQDKKRFLKLLDTMHKVK